MYGLLNDLTSGLLTKSLDVAALRQRVISNNIANVNTPGFKRSYVSFEEQLRQAMTQAGRPLSEGSLSSVKPVVNKDESLSMRNDGNNVDMDVEMTNLAMNSINYNTAAQQINKKFAMLRYVISAGRG